MPSHQSPKEPLNQLKESLSQAAVDTVTPVTKNVTFIDAERQQRYAAQQRKASKLFLEQIKRINNKY